jgi:hypothetical protein
MLSALAMPHPLIAAPAFHWFFKTFTTVPRSGYTATPCGRAKVYSDAFAHASLHFGHFSECRIRMSCISGFGLSWSKRLHQACPPPPLSTQGQECPLGITHVSPSPTLTLTVNSKFIALLLRQSLHRLK